jgi:hypothetical protein
MKYITMNRIALTLLLSSAGLASAAINPPYTADANTVHLWHFDEPLVTPNNSAGRQYPNDAPGVITPWRLDNGYYDPTYQSGIMGGTGYTGFGGAGVLDHSPNYYEFRKGNNDYGIPPGGTAGSDITATQLLGSTNGAFTIDGMIQWDGGQGGSIAGHILNTEDSAFKTTKLRLVMQNAGTVPVFTIGLPNNESFTTTVGLVPALTTSDWYHFALTFDGNNAGGSPLKFYWTKVEPSATRANLVQTFSSNSTTAYDVTNSFQLGEWGGNNFDGLVDEVRISNVARSATDMLFVSASGYASWAAAQVPPVTGDPSDDSNNDGVANGVAYFMDEAGLATNPGIVGGSVTWPNGAKIPKTEYGAGKQFVVQTSSDLQSWNDVADTDPNLILTDYSAGPPVVEASVKYTLPTGAPKSFVRLKVIPN